MTIWVDAQLPPAIAAWITESYEVEAVAVRDLGLRDAADQDIFAAAQAAEAIVLTKDRDFVHLVERHGPPPHVLWLTCGNTSNARLREILSVALGDALTLVAAGERHVSSPPARSLREAKAHKYAIEWIAIHIRTESIPMCGC